MKVLLNIFKNPFAIATVMVHWVVFFYAIIFEDTRWFSTSTSAHRSDYMYQWLETLNVIPFIIIEAVGTFLDMVIGTNVLLNIAMIMFALFIINFQWLVVGYCISKLFMQTRTIFPLKIK